MIKAVIFDIGGVLLTEGPDYARELVCDLTGMSYSRVNKSFHLRWNDWKHGKISAEEFWKSFIEDIKSDAEIDIAYLREKSTEMVHEIDSMLSFASGMRQKGYKIGIISNNTAEWAEYEKEKFRLPKIFDAIVLSNEEGISKPDPEIFRICMKRLGVKPSECIFIDDNKNNVKAAQEVGMGAVAFKDSEQLKKDLEKMGVV
jgi:epoxide hydrolase-like predicted phosphatase